MMTDFRKELVKAVSAAGIEEKLVDSIMEVPQRREMGDFAIPCFKLSAKFRKAPFEIAKELKDRIVLPKGIMRSEAKGPYLNFFVDRELAASLAMAMLLSNSKKAKKGGRIIVEYCQANPMKAFHVGHVRNICLGESIARLFEERGLKVTRVDYGGDVGPHVSKTLYAYRELKHRPEPRGAAEQGKWLGELYAAGAKAVKENQGLEQKMRDMVVELEKRKDRRLYADWKKLRKMSLAYFDWIYSELGVKFDRVIMESQVEKEGIRIAKELLKKRIAVADSGALLIDMEEHGLGKFLVLKSDGAALYSTKDIALAKLKKSKLKASVSYNVVGAEQTHYFKQLTRTIQNLNEVKEEYCEVVHLPYELVRLEGGKMSSREGNVITYDELFRAVLEKTLSETRQRHPEWSGKRTLETARKIAFAAIKFGMLGHDRNKVITFNWEKATALDGETGPFVLYSYARARSILRKAGKFSLPEKFGFATEKENSLLAMLSDSTEKVAEAATANSPGKVARHLLDLCSEFNSFYHEVPVLQGGGEMLGQRLALVTAFTRTVSKLAGLLNIDLLEEM